jgi:ribosomal protein S18 acetylase RimI-like enzyme
MERKGILRRFKARDGREVILRAPSWDDLDDMLELVNSLVEERAEVNVCEPYTREEEADWMAGLLAAVEKGERLSVVAEVEGHVIGHVEVRIGRCYESHTGVVGIAVRRGFRDLGIGTELMRMTERLAKERGLELLTLEVFATNSRAIHVYEKLRYTIVGRVPKAVYKEESYVDKLIMAKDLRGGETRLKG